MSLQIVPLELNSQSLPSDISQYLAEASTRIDGYLAENPVLVRGFLPSSFVEVYRAFQFIRDNHLATGDRMCEWGSGFGVVASLASINGFEAWGIEIQARLIEASRELADDFAMDVEFVHGSFVPSGSDHLIDQAFAEQEGDISLEPHHDDAYADMGFSVDEFDVIFCYPWPNDIPLVERIFSQFASTGALLMTYRERGQVLLQRKG